MEPTAGELEVAPTHTEALQAAWILKKYTEVIDSPFACRFETMLGAFGQETHAIGIWDMKEMKITDYFPCKRSDTP